MSGEIVAVWVKYLSSLSLELNTKLAEISINTCSSSVTGVSFYVLYEELEVIKEANLMVSRSGFF